MNINNVRVPYPTTENTSEVPLSTQSSLYKSPHSYLCTLQLWVHYIRAEEALVAATLLLVALLRGFASESEVSAFHRDIGILDRVILHQLGSIGSHGASGSDLLDSPEARLAVCLRTTGRARLMRCVGSRILSHSSVERPNVPSARIKLHRYRAFMGHPRILKRFAAVTPMQSSERDSAIDTRRGEEFSGRAAQMFPFSSEHSHRVCLESATAIAHGFDRLRSLGIRGEYPMYHICLWRVGGCRKLTGLPIQQLRRPARQTSPASL